MNDIRVRVPTGRVRLFGGPDWRIAATVAVSKCGSEYVSTDNHVLSLHPCVDTKL